MTEEKKQLYSVLYTMAKDIVTTSNVCDHRDGMCSRERDRKERKVQTNKYCCCGDPNGKASVDIHCQYLTDTGCTVKNLDCMVWLCKHADEKLKKYSIYQWLALERIRLLTRINGFMEGRKLLF